MEKLVHGKSRVITCPECGGAGEVDIDTSHHGSPTLERVTCHECKGLKRILHVVYHAEEYIVLK